jgi:hypothetical protein
MTAGPFLSLVWMTSKTGRSNRDNTIFGYSKKRLRRGRLRLRPEKLQLKQQLMRPRKGMMQDLHLLSPRLR